MGVDVLATALSGGNAAFLADCYKRWSLDPRSVDPSFASLFEVLGDEERAILADTAGAEWAKDGSGIELGVKPLEKDTVKPAKAAIGGDATAAAEDTLRAILLIRAFRTHGHLEAKLDPLGLQNRPARPELDPATYGFTPADLSRPIYIGKLLADLLGRETATVSEIVTALRKVYCGPAGIEFTHIVDTARRTWIRERVETADCDSWAGADEKKTILKYLTEAEGFESFCQKRYVGMKRFGLEGGEVAIPALHAIIGEAARRGVNEVAIGMPHRGRLNTLANIVRKPFVNIFSEFGGVSFKPDNVQGSGDVKYHLGTSTDVELAGHAVHISLQPNPSHLEAVDPVIAGKVRARQDLTGDVEGRHSVLGIMLHGDAAFAGQGVVYETLSMSQLEGYRTGGTVHVIVNNQIGFTTNPVNGHSGIYGTDVAKSVQAPIFHVDGDDPEAVVFFARLASDYRQTFGSDVVLDIVCYRRFGHNESDEPAFTQPVMYKAIRAHESCRTLYAAKLAAQNVVSAEDSAAEWDAFHASLDKAFDVAKTYKPNKADWFERSWSGLRAMTSEDLAKEVVTGVDLALLRKVGAALHTVPADFDLNPKIARQLEAKKAMLDTGEGFDWAMGEALAFGTLMEGGHHVRLSGEDVQRGTFSHRHAVLLDQTTQQPYTPLNHIADGQAKIEIYNSLLSEFAVLGYEYGYTMADPKSLVLWEAQFGDFANGAQVIVDQFIASGETKWLRTTGLVMLLPHGYEGQGPEHSSARLERYLQMCAEDNMIICNLTTPANYFHALRRQLVRDFRKPLINMSPKSLLRAKLAVSTLDEMGPGTTFRPVIDEIDPIEAAGVKRVVMCSGKVYYDLLTARREKKIEDVAIVRLEQLYPFPDQAIAAVLKRYPNAQLVWCQEEPENMGGWQFVDRRLEKVLRQSGRASEWPAYAGRPAAASPATGSAKDHAAQQSALVQAALTVN
ncbi:2-oxoglutarate dehydrogenase E1 component [Brytella acorum]|uniref:2-oxoglutarate dehydrogenase E1 component n=1 Tax=Brytella acorum TaxID=2959299 RepID=A0AA35V0L1_9PROT|nr:2-oxoglutarate dehydrogenase E1 component [Brytella acorum]MDF3623398.1 2-oxoglutarate dehydrogenase E1 component [Brytella acorum]CAI9120505.1 2-oxoglutarate dehydrogenase E1 component [Brytella acorum]